MSPQPIRRAGWHARGVALFSGRLLVRPAARPDESFPGYRLRIAFANGLSNAGWLDCSDSSLPKAHGIARWCPRCLSTPGCYWREEWYSGPAACLVHNCWLTSVCSVCRRTLRWKQVRFAICSCGAPLQEAAVEEFSADVLKLISDRVASSFALLSVEGRWNLACFVGALSQFGLHGKPLKKATRQTENVEQLLVTAGASLIADRVACFELLDRLRAPQMSVNNVPLLSEVFPNLLTMLRKRLSGAERRWMLDLLNVYVANSSCRGSAVLWEPKGITGQTDNKLRERRKTRNPAIAAMLTRTGVTVPVRRTRAGRQKFLISDVDLQCLRRNQHPLVPLKAAARYAGMSTRRIQALATGGLIQSTGARIDMRSVNRLLDGIAAASVRNVSAFEDPVSLADALRLYVPVDASTAFFNQLMNGSFRLAFEPDKAPMLKDIVVDRDEVVFAVRMSVESSSQISIVEAARRLGIKQEVMYHLINVGLVRTQTGKLQRRTARVVDVDDLQKFTEQFLPLFTVAKAMGISAREAPAWARQHGIEIVTGPSIDGGRQYWIRRQPAWTLPAA